MGEIIINLPPDLEKSIDALIAQGTYKSKEEAIIALTRAGLRAIKGRPRAIPRRRPPAPPEQPPVPPVVPPGGQPPIPPIEPPRRLSNDGKSEK